ncbi:MAG: hypothetical protein HOL98_01055 [Gammaproteobacteria bacterium]|nr:hypothetical protein [Gammaproteobacteria bacterium]MBT5202017.1 hypothetical protein [Gammaproteobacteria bacterium]MBT5600742.1 hypothetical protein [Gammaproteobacteria bacterium]MBT6243915.1 hypothetical protein [Gammaproteobacteria bacterium]
MNLILISQLSLAEDSRLPIKVEISGSGEQYQLLRAGAPYSVLGAGAHVNDLPSLRAHGANSVRTWHVGEGEILDQAEALGMTVSLCLDVARERLGFDYDDSDKVAEQLANLTAQVQRFHQHPALLTWIIGNELNFDSTNPKVWDAVNDIAEMIHRVDPYHPVTTALAGLDPRVIGLVKERAPALDFLSIQVYGGLLSLGGAIQRANLEMPVMVTEWGTIGHWEVPATTWGAPIELTSFEKAQHYQQGYEDVIQKLAGQVIGSYAFLWGQKQERTPTWYGTLTTDGYPTEAADRLYYLWQGSWPANRAPTMANFSLDNSTAADSVRLQAGGRYLARVDAVDPDDDPLTYTFWVMQESDSSAVGGDKESVPERQGQAIKPSGESERLITVPGSEGAYRLFVQVSDAQNSAAHANIPFYVE